MTAALCKRCREQPAAMHRGSVPVCVDCAREIDLLAEDDEPPAGPALCGCGARASVNLDLTPMCRECAAELH